MAYLDNGTVLLGRYQIVSRRGEGGMAVLYQAFDQRRQVYVALKAMKPDFAEDTDFLRRFRREAEHLKQLDHPHIVRLYEFEEDELLAFMVLDYIDGDTLRAVRRRHGRPLSPGEALGYLRPVCAALAYAHSQNVVHCDIKPANIMIDRAGRVYVADFGIARASESATVTFSTPGTAQYMAPEQWRGGEDVYPATDVYALGVLLFELLTGRQPFTGESIQTRGHTREKIMREHLAAEAPPASSLNPELPPEFDDILRRCLAKQPEERYRSVTQLLSAFEAAAHRLGLREVPVPPVAVEARVEARPAPARPLPDGPRPPAPTQPPPAPVPWRPAREIVFTVVASVSVLLVVGAIALLGQPGGQMATATLGSGTTATAGPTIVVITATPKPVTATAEPPPPTATPPPPTTEPPTSKPIGVGPALGDGLIAYTSDLSGRDAIWVMDANGGQPVQMSDPPSGVGDWLPEWCSSNQWLLFERGDHVTATQNQRLFWTAYGEVAGQERPWPYVPSRASLTGSPACPAAGPDVYLGAVAQQTDWHLYRSTGAEATVFGLGFEKLAAVAVSIDGQRVAFAYRDVVDNSGKYYLHVASTSDPHDFALIQPSGVDSVLSMGWSPDGARLAYVCQVTGSRVWQLCLSNATGGGLSVPTLVIRDQAQARGNLTALAGSPTWSPDGQWVVFASNQDGDWDIYKYNVNDGRVVNLTAGSPANEFMPSWSR